MYFLIYFTLDIIEQCAYYLKFLEDGGELASGKLKSYMWTLKTAHVYITSMNN